MSTNPFFPLLDNPRAWQVCASGQAEGRVSRIAGSNRTPGLRLDFDFHGGGGFVAIRRVVDCTLPQTFEITFQVRGSGLSNNLEFKVADPGGANVWRYVRRDFTLPETWSECRIRERDLPFAWGPAGGGAPSAVGAIEFVIAAGPGGKGWLELATVLLEDQTPRQPHAVLASSTLTGFSPESVMADGSGPGWRAETDDPAPWWAVDFGHAVRFGGLVIGWPAELQPRAFVVESSADGQSWTCIHQASRARGALSHIPAPGAEARHLRIRFDHSRCAALQSVSLRPDAFSSTPNEFVHSVAADFPRGWFPRYWHREQSYWTPVGSPAGKRRALINEEGMVETDEAGFSLEPYVLTENGLLTWADVKTSVSLAAGGIPLPVVVWQTTGIRLEIMPWVDGKGPDLTLHVTYRLACGKTSAHTRLCVAVRPFQVNPPWQAFRNLGGRSPIHRISCELDGLQVEGRAVTFTPEPAGTGAATFEEGGALAYLTDGKPPPERHVNDPSGLASAAVLWDLPSSGTTLDVTVSVPYYDHTTARAKSNKHRALARWRKTLGKVEWQVPDCAAPAFDCFRTSAGHILINRDGPAIQPGPRRYTRSWIRDCVIMGAALAKAGLPRPLREFLTWYARFQRADGFVPCVVDRDGIDWLVEHDSHGQFLWGIREVFRHSGSATFVRKMWPRVRKAADFLISLRDQRMTGTYRSGGHAACFGLLPESASHEGYLAHPVHSYWDDFWGVRGLEAAADLATALDLTNCAGRWRLAARDFQGDLLRSIATVIDTKHLAYIPGSVEWADFDPTATANAIAMLDFADVLPAAPMHAMLDTYLDGFRRRHRGEMPWNNYTAYEIRIIGAFVRLGRRDEANELLDFFLTDRRPREWNQWPEISWRDPRSPGHLGDVPHTWIAAEYLLALASMVACERESSASLVLAAGMPWAWIAGGQGFAVSKLPTRFGTLDFTIAADTSDTIRIGIGGSIELPPGGIKIAPPLPAGRKIVSALTSDGNQLAVEIDGGSVMVPSLPVQAVLHLGS